MVSEELAHLGTDSKLLKGMERGILDPLTKLKDISASLGLSC